MVSAIEYAHPAVAQANIVTRLIYAKQLFLIHLFIKASTE